MNTKEVKKIRKQVTTTKILIPLLLLCLTLLFFISSASATSNSAATIYVNGSNGADTNDGSSWATAKLTIANATETVDPNGIVKIADGQYTGTGNTNIPLTKNMTIIGESQNGTIINGTGTSWVFNIQSGVTVTICNLTITDGYTTGYGGAIYNQGNLTVINSTFQNNSAQYGNGGAIYNWNTGNGFINCTVIQSNFQNNNAQYGNGGAIYNWNTGNGFINCTVIQSNFENNQAYYGGAIGNDNAGGGSVNCTVTQSNFQNNTAPYGAAINNWIAGGSVNCTVTQSNFQNNNATLGGAIRNNKVGGNSLIFTANFNRFYNNTATTSGNTIYNNGGSVDIENNWWGTNNPNWTQFLSGVSSNPIRWVQLTINATPDVLCVSETSTVTANLNYNNMGEDLMATYGKSIPTVEVLFDVDSLGTLSTYNGIISNGNNVTTTFTAGQMPGTSTVNGTVDNATVYKNIAIQREDVYVATAADGGSDSNNGTADSPFLTLQKAIDVLQIGGRIHIANGEYTGSQNRGLTITKNMTILQDTWITGTGSSVILNAENKDCILYNGPYNGYTLVLRNLILVNGNSTGSFSYGGAIQNAGNLTVENCTFLGNTAEYGGAIANVFYGGIMIMYSGTCTEVQEYSYAITSTIIGCTFANNIATYDGGAISNYIYNSCTAEAYNGANLTLGLYSSIISSITNCTFTNNTASSGGAISNNCTVNGTAISEEGNATALSNGNINSTITGCTLANNTATYGGAISDYCDMDLEATSTNANTSVNGNCTINNTIIDNTLINNTATYGGGLSAAYSYNIQQLIHSGSATINHELNLTSEVHFNRIIGNTAALGSAIFGFYSSTANATYNWWGSNDNPASQISGYVNYSPWLFMIINATPDTINNTQTSTITVSFNNYSSDGSSSSPLDPNLGHIPNGVPVTFSLIGDILGSLDEPLAVTTTTGTASILFTASNVGIQQINATTDNQNVTATVTINPASYVDITKEFRDLPWGEVITTAYYNDKIYAIVKVHNSGPDNTTSINVLDLLDGLTWTGNYYVYRTVGSYPNTESAWVLNDLEHPFNGTNWDVGSLSTMIGSERWLAIEVMVNQTGTVSNYAETVNQSSYAYQGYDNYTAYLTANVDPTSLVVNNARGNKDETVTLKAVLTDYLGNLLSGKTVEFWIDGVKVGENTTDTNGTAIFNYVITETPGNHTLAAIFNGDTQYQSSNLTGQLYVPEANLYITVTSDKNNPGVGETFTLTYKLGNSGPDTAENVTITIPIPDGYVISAISGDGTWIINGTNIIWSLGNVTVGDPYLYITGWTTQAGNYMFTASIASNTYNINSRGITPLTITANSPVNPGSNTQVNAASNSTVEMQNTGAPLVGMILAILMVLGGLVGTRKKQ
ncbi:beta strand repeat-containing protein [Methanobacterium ferruginis]|uniref:beta strand repeat-containing protein n=1 Tax=Methanobacterium ferruginis TaxID=710191 RepID=UPI002572EA5E|nr:Ig-like domain repeat protein [Methanobacterium ferruginis]BDZ68722.1 hypothetical protein GCM10025860_21700 [Methanobacterium ferruginis]